MRCPHCLDSFNADAHQKHRFATQNQDSVGLWTFECYLCPSCNKYSFYLLGNPWQGLRMVYPKAISRVPLSEAVKDPYRTDYIELGCLNRPISLDRFLDLSDLLEIQ